MRWAFLAAVALAPGAAVHACDRDRAVQVARVAAAREGADVSTLQLAAEGPYGPAKFARTHPTFRTSPAVKRKLARRTFYFVWFHAPFVRGVGARGADAWALVDSSRCRLLHLAGQR